MAGRSEKGLVLAKMPVYVVRHGDAQARDAWHGDDRDRPLTGKGVRQARALSDYFDAGPLAKRRRGAGARPLEKRPTRIVSSAAERCLATVRPLAGACALSIETADFLAEGTDPQTALGRLEGMVISDPGVVVACTHGDVIWGILTALGQAGVPLDGQGDAKKGSIWVLELDGPAVASARYLPPVGV